MYIKIILNFLPTARDWSLAGQLVLHVLDIDAGSDLGGRQGDALLPGLQPTLDPYCPVRLLHDQRVELDHDVVHEQSTALWERQHAGVSEELLNRCSEKKQGLT